MTRRRSKILTGVAVAGIAVSVAPAPSQAEDGPARPSFTAVASADGGRLTFTVPNFAAVEEVIDGGGVVAQSYFDAFNQTSYAALPHPGANALAFPGVVAAVTGQAFPFSYPLYVAASNPANPKQVLADPSGTYHLAADASGRKTEAASSFGHDGASNSAGSRALTSVTVDGDSVTAAAENRNEALSLGDGALRIFYVQSRSVTKQMGSAPSTTDTQLTVSAAAANGMTLGFGPQGLELAQQGVPVPARSGLESFNAALAPAHLAVRFATAKPVPGGASAAVFEVVSAQPPPSSEIPASITTLRFGGATSGITLEGHQNPAAADAPAGADPSQSTAPDQSAAPAGASPGSALSSNRPGTGSNSAFAGPDGVTSELAFPSAVPAVPDASYETPAAESAVSTERAPNETRPVNLAVAGTGPLRGDSVRYLFGGLGLGVLVAMAFVIVGLRPRGETR